MLTSASTLGSFLVFGDSLATSAHLRRWSRILLLFNSFLGHLTRSFGLGLRLGRIERLEFTLAFHFQADETFLHAALLPVGGRTSSLRPEFDLDGLAAEVRGRDNFPSDVSREFANEDVDFVAGRPVGDDAVVAIEAIVADAFNQR